MGAFELVVRPLDTATLPLVDSTALLGWTLRLLRESGFELRAAVATSDALRIVAVTRTPQALFRLATWFPTLEARPLHTVDAYIDALARVRATAARG